MDLKKSFAEKLHNARLMRGLSMQQLCDMMGNIITKQTLSKYENGVMLNMNTEDVARNFVII